jgi:hypothetical protein
MADFWDYGDELKDGTKLIISPAVPETVFVHHLMRGSYGITHVRGEMKYMYRTCVGKSQGKKLLSSQGYKWENNAEHQKGAAGGGGGGGHQPPLRFGKKKNL